MRHYEPSHTPSETHNAIDRADEVGGEIEWIHYVGQDHSSIYTLRQDQQYNYRYWCTLHKTDPYHQDPRD